jgi:hypothetical protein
MNPAASNKVAHGQRVRAGSRAKANDSREDQQCVHCLCYKVCVPPNAHALLRAPSARCAAASATMASRARPDARHPPGGCSDTLACRRLQLSLLCALNALKSSDDVVHLQAEHAERIDCSEEETEDE